MNNKQYNNIIEHTLKHEKTTDSLETARAIFKNMGVALPQGDVKEVSDILKTNSYMGWRACDATEAQKTADKGIAAIGVDEEKIIVLSANDEEQPVEQNASVMTLSNDVDVANNSSNMRYYAYNNGTTTQDMTNEGLTNFYNNWNEVVFTNLDTLQRLAQEYIQNGFGNGDQVRLVLQFIRRNKYDDENWDNVAGEVDDNFVNFVRYNNEYIYNFFTTETLLIYDHNYLPVDFIHLCATMNGIIVGGGTYWKALVVGSHHVRNLAGWAGDLQTLVVDAYILTNKSEDYNTFYYAIYRNIGNEQFSFGMKDLLADIDAYNFANNSVSQYWQSNLFGSACRYYYNNIDIPGTGYTSRSCLRFTQFLGGDSKEFFANTVSQYTSQYWIYSIEWPIYEKEASKRNITLDLKSSQSNAARDAFTNFIWQKYLLEKQEYLS